MNELLQYLLKMGVPPELAPQLAQQLMPPRLEDVEGAQQPIARYSDYQSPHSGNEYYAGEEPGRAPTSNASIGPEMLQAMAMLMGQGGMGRDLSWQPNGSPGRTYATNGTSSLGNRSRSK